MTTIRGTLSRFITRYQSSHHAEKTSRIDDDKSGSCIDNGSSVVSRFHTLRRFFTFGRFKSPPKYKSIKISNELFDSNSNVGVNYQDEVIKCQQTEQERQRKRFLTMQMRRPVLTLTEQLEKVHILGYNHGASISRPDHDEYIEDTNNYWKSNKHDGLGEFMDIDLESISDFNLDPYDKVTHYSNNPDADNPIDLTSKLKPKPSQEPDLAYTTSAAQLFHIKRIELELALERYQQLPQLQDQLPEEANEEEAKEEEAIQADGDDGHTELAEDPNSITSSIPINDDDKSSSEDHLKTISLRKSLSRLSFHNLNMLFP